MALSFGRSTRPSGPPPRAEFLEDFVVGRQARLDEPMGQGVGVEDGEAHFAEHGGDGAFAAGDAAGESGRSMMVNYRALASIALRKIWARRVGGARLSPCYS